MQLTHQQNQAVTSTSPRIFCIAGPGSGKTRTLIQRILHLIERGIEPRRIVAITFTNAAAREIETRLVDSGFLGELGYVGTLHSFMLRLILKHGALIGYSGRCSVMDNEGAAEFLNSVVEEHAWKGTSKLLSEEIRKGPPPSDKFMTREGIVAGAYWNKLRQARLITFDGLLILGERLLREMIKRGIHPGYEEFLIDEVQDSSDRDFAIYQHLQSMGNVFMVGDPDQSIYSFRGGNVKNALAIASNPDWDVIPLAENFRSDILICQAANALISRNTVRYQKETVPVSTETGRVDLVCFDSPAVEGIHISQTIARLMHIPATDRPYGYRAFAVLVRTNDLVEEYRNMMRAASIPVQSSRQPQRPADWHFVAATLAFMQNPNDDHAAYRWLYMKNSKEFADAARLKASQEYSSINDVTLRLDAADLTQVAPFLAGNGVSPESQAVVSVAMQRMDTDNQTIGELIMELGKEEEYLEGDNDGVTVCTIHAAKGREWPCVFLPAFEQHTIPGERRGLNIEEERRLAYVAVTRAKHALHVSYVDKRAMKWGTSPLPVDVIPSQFIPEMQMI
jgi:DNA helicase-2/ATP-dependent DNA helicase PcrA